MNLRAKHGKIIIHVPLALGRPPLNEKQSGICLFYSLVVTPMPTASYSLPHTSDTMVLATARIPVNPPSSSLGMRVAYIQAVERGTSIAQQNGASKSPV